MSADADTHYFLLASLRRHYPVQVVRVGNRFGVSISAKLPQRLFSSLSVKRLHISRRKVNSRDEIWREISLRDHA